jgi:hypothetical protein
MVLLERGDGLKVKRSAGRRRSGMSRGGEEEEEFSSEEGDDMTDSEGCNLPVSEYDTVTDSDGYDTIPESEYEGFTDSEQHNIPESGFWGDNDELGCEGSRGREGGGQFELGGLIMMVLDDEDEKEKMAHLSVEYTGLCP